MSIYVDRHIRVETAVLAGDNDGLPRLAYWSAGGVAPVGRTVRLASEKFRLRG